MALYNANLKPLSPGTGTHDYAHAAKLFLADNLRLAPKQSFLYYVCLNVNQDFLSSIVGMGISSQSLTDQYEAGMMVKSIDLPKFTFDTKVMNAYNKKSIVQNKIQYDPISVTFHDDAANVVLNFWNDYYTYYYRDSDYESALYTVPTTYDLRQRTKWGYSPLNSSLRPFLRDIQIFSLNQKRFTEYRLINPMITGWRHGDHRADEGSGTMESTMTVAYETVKYRTGYVNPVDVNGFSLLHYDNTQSPISTSTTNIYTDQGIPGVLGGATRDLARTDGSASGVSLINNYLAVQRAYQNLKNVNWGTVAQATLSQIGVNVVSGAINGAANGLFVPYVNSPYSGIPAQNTTNLPGFSFGALSTPYSNVGVNSMYPSAYQTGYVTSGNQLIDRATGAVVGRVNQGVDSYFALQPTSGKISLGSDGQPVIGTTISKVLDPVTGEVITQFEVGTTAGGGYTSSNDHLNLVETKVLTAEDGSMVTYRRYMNGDVMMVDGENNTTINYAKTTPTFGSTPTSSVLNRYGSGATYAVNPFTGELSILNGVANRVISAPINIATNLIDRGLTYATNSIITNLIDPIGGKIDQAINGLTGQIANIFGFGESADAQKEYLVCTIDGTVQGSMTDFGMTYAKDFTGETVSVYQDLALNNYQGGGDFYDW